MALYNRHYPSKPPDETSWFGVDFSNVLPFGINLTGGNLQILTNTNPPQTQSSLLPVVPDTFEVIGDPAGAIIGFQTSTSTADIIGRQTLSDVEVEGRRVYAFLSGGIPGTDYQLRWLTRDNLGNVWHRTTLVLCAVTS